MLTPPLPLKNKLRILYTIHCENTSVFTRKTYKNIFCRFQQYFLALGHLAKESSYNLIIYCYTI